MMNVTLLDVVAFCLGLIALVLVASLRFRPYLYVARMRDKVGERPTGSLETTEGKFRWAVSNCRVIAADYYRVLDRAERTRLMGLPSLSKQYDRLCRERRASLRAERERAELLYRTQMRLRGLSDTVREDTASRFNKLEPFQYVSAELPSSLLSGKTYSLVVYSRIALQNAFFENFPIEAADIAEVDVPASWSATVRMVVAGSIKVGRQEGICTIERQLSLDKPVFAERIDVFPNELGEQRLHILCWREGLFVSGIELQVTVV